MLVPAMNNKEVTTEVFRDYEKITGTIERLKGEYHRERKKLGVDKLKPYVKEYAVKTARKNQWIIFVQKVPTTNRYHNTDDIACFAVVYYYGPSGLRVFKPLGDKLEVFNGHLFTRYNERMELNLPYQLDVIKAFFRNNGYLVPQPVKRGDREYIMSACMDGFTFGNVFTSDEWLLHKTFITHDMSALSQMEIARRYMEEANLKMATGDDEAIRTLNPFNFRFGNRTPIRLGATG